MPDVTPTPRYLAIPGVLIGGVLMTLTITPFDWWLLAFPSIGLLYWGIAGTSPGQRFWRSMLWSTALYVPSLWWMTVFSLPGGIIVGLLEAFITSLCLTILVRSRTALSSMLGVVGALMIADSLRSLWPFGGLPLGGIDLGQASGPVAHTITLGGRLFLVGVVAAGGVAIGHAGITRTWRIPVGLTGLVGVTVLGCLFAFKIDEPMTPTSPDYCTVALIQGGGPRGLRASNENAKNTFDAHIDATATLKQPVDVIFWPENTVDADTFEGSAQQARLVQIARTRNTWISAGITEDNGPTSFINSQIMIDPTGKTVGRFDKVRRVPFGEYFPLRSIIEGLGLAKLPARDATPGKGPGILTAAGTTYAVLVSYEGFFDDRARVGVRAGGQVIIIPTNSSSYKNDQLPLQQMAAARLRALETRRTVLQVGPTGITAKVSPNGEVRSTSKLGDQHVTVTMVERHNGMTPYVRFNDLPALIIAALCLVGSQLLVRGARVNPD